MSHIPNPFRKDTSSYMMSPSPPRQATPPGFLMMTRPPNASSIGHDGRGRSMGRANYKSNYYPRPRGPYSSNSNNFIPFGNQNKRFNNRGNPNNLDSQVSPVYNKNLNQQSYHSPGNRPNFFRKHNSFPGSPCFQSTPNTFQRSHKRERGFSKRNSLNNLSQSSFHKTPLKTVPVDKFISINMVKDPWEEMDSDIDFEVCNDPPSNKESDSLSSDSLLKKCEIVIDSDSSFSLDGGGILGSTSTAGCAPILEMTSDSPVGPFTTSSSEKDTGTESDTVSDS